MVGTETVATEIQEEFTDHRTAACIGKTRCTVTAMVIIIETDPSIDQGITEITRAAEIFLRDRPKKSMVATRGTMRQVSKKRNTKKIRTIATAEIIATTIEEIEIEINTKSRLTEPALLLFLNEDYFLNPSSAIIALYLSISLFLR